MIALLKIMVITLWFSVVGGTVVSLTIDGESFSDYLQNVATIFLLLTAIEIGIFISVSLIVWADL